MVTRWAAVSFGAGTEEGLVEVRKAWMGAQKGFGALLPGTARMVVILDEVEVGGEKGSGLRW